MSRLIAALLALLIASCDACREVSEWRVVEADNDKVELDNVRPAATTMVVDGQLFTSKPPEAIASEHCSAKGKAAISVSTQRRATKPFEAMCTQPMAEVRTFHCIGRADLMGPDAVELTPREIAQALEHYPEAAPALAERLDAETQYQVGRQFGRTGEAWYCSAAHRGSAEAMRTLGFFNFYGVGEEGFDLSSADLPRAYMWYALAAKRGNSMAQERLGHLLPRMNARELAEGKRLLAEWQPNPAECEAFGSGAEN